MLECVQAFTPKSLTNRRQSKLTGIICLTECAFTFWNYHWTHCLNLYVMGSQFKCSNFLWDICFNLSNCRQKLMHLFWVVWILYFNFFVRFGYQAEHAWSKWDCIRGRSIFIFPRKTSFLCFLWMNGFWGNLCDVFLFQNIKNLACVQNTSICWS